MNQMTIGNATLYCGDCLDVLKTLPTNSVDSVVCDPPYGLSFMGKKWDYDVPSVDIWAECLRVLKPGGHLLAFAGTRTQHRMAVRIEDAGFEIRDMIAWVYGSGFPKSHNVGKSIDREAGAQREVVGKAAAGSAPLKRGHVNTSGGGLSVGTERSPEYDITAPATEAAHQWQGWGTALKPALEPITMARKPLVGTVAANVLEHGTGALNIDGCRVEYEDDCRLLKGGSYGGNRTGAAGTSVFGTGGNEVSYQGGVPEGRWPANLIHDGSSDVVAAFPDSNGSGTARVLKRGAKTENNGWGMNTTAADFAHLPDAGTGSAARFFYCAKASKSDRGAGNTHPTVKPTDLMAYLCRLITPHGGVVLDPFMGSGTTGVACIQTGRKFIGIEREERYFEIACRRIEQAVAQGQLFAPEPVKQVQEALL